VIAMFPFLNTAPRNLPWETGPWCVRCHKEMARKTPDKFIDIFTCPKCGYQVEIVWD